MSSAVWRGRFSSIAEAQTDYPHTSQVGLFALESWLSRHAQTWSKHVTTPTTLDELVDARLSFLPPLVAGLQQASVLDLGGGSGWCYRSLVRAGGSVLKYTVIDLPSVVDAYSFREDETLQWKTLEQFTTSPTRVDILYSNSALQYMPDNGTLVALMRMCRPQYVLLDELMWSRGQDWFTLQDNSDAPVIARFASIDALFGEILNLGLAPSWAHLVQGTSSLDFPDMSAFNPRDRIPGYLSVLFRRT